MADGGDGRDVSPHFSERGTGGGGTALQNIDPTFLSNTNRHEKQLGSTIVRLSTIFLLSLLLFFVKNVLGSAWDATTGLIRPSDSLQQLAATRCLRQLHISLKDQVQVQDQEQGNANGNGPLTFYHRSTPWMTDVTVFSSL